MVIVGAGPTGLGAAERLAELGHRDVVILERERHPGGHAASFRTPEGFTFDLGGHVTFSRDPRFLAAVERALGGRFLSHERRALVYTHDRLVPYPFQNNVASLPPEAAWECLEGLLARRGGEPSRTFLDHMRASFGDGITRQFLLPYNRKVWAHDPADMATTWLADRVSEVSLADVLRPFVFGPHTTWGPNATFRYPEEGTGAIYRGMAARLPAGWLRYGQRVTAVDAERRQVHTATGERIPFDALISSMPIDLLARSLRRAPRAVRRAAEQLVHNQGVFVGVGVRGRPMTHHWTYFPEPRFPFYRVTILSNYSPRLVPRRGVFSLLAEVSRPAGTRASPADLTRAVVAALLETPLMRGRSEADIVCTWARAAPYSYPIPTLGRDEALQVIQDHLRSHGIHSRGRFGGFAYEQGNMDHSYLAGAEAAASILGVPSVSEPA